MPLLALLLVPLAANVDSIAANAGAANVERVLPGDKLIIHIRDYHILDKALLGKNLEMDGKELDDEFAKLTKEAGAVHESKKLILKDATLVREYTGDGEYLSVHHPDTPGALDATALCLMGAARGAVGDIFFV